MYGRRFFKMPQLSLAEKLSTILVPIRDPYTLVPAAEGKKGTFFRPRYNSREFTTKQVPPLLFFKIHTLQMTAEDRGIRQRKTCTRNTEKRAHYLMLVPGV